MVSLLVMLVSYEWILRLYSDWYMVIILCISVLIYLGFSSFLAHECIPFSHQTLQPQKPFKKPWNLLLFNWIFEIVLACFLVALETISGTNRLQDGQGVKLRFRQHTEHVLLCLWFSSYLAHDCIPCLSPNFITRKTFSKTLKPSFLWLNIWDCVGLFFCGLETISGTNIFGAVAGERSWKQIFP